MMNDTTNLTAVEKATLAKHLLTHRAYPELNPQPQGEATMNVTMHEEPTQEWPLQFKGHHALDAIIQLLSEHIDMLVETKFNQLVANTKALSLMDEELKNTITELIDDAISVHNDKYDHDDFVTTNHVSNQINDETDEQIDHYLRHARHNLVTEDKVAELVRDALDEQLDEAIENKLENATLSISL